GGGPGGVQGDGPGGAGGVPGGVSDRLIAGLEIPDDDLGRVPEVDHVERTPPGELPQRVAYVDTAGQIGPTRCSVLVVAVGYDDARQPHFPHDWTGCVLQRVDGASRGVQAALARDDLALDFVRCADPDAPAVA